MKKPKPQCDHEWEPVRAANGKTLGHRCKRCAKQVAAAVPIKETTR